jgi:HAD superfamily hydrolase (TIGR01549 family)
MTEQSPLEAIVFDMDGTLFESQAVIPAAYIATVSSLGGRRYSPAEIVEAYSIGPPPAMLSHLLGRTVTPDDLERYYGRLADVMDGVRVYAGIEESLAALAGVVPMAVFTGASLRACSLLMEQTGLAGYFDVLVGADEVPHPKPAPDGILLACERLGVLPGASAYVGDAPIDLLAARRAGTLAVAAGWGHQFVSDEPADLVLAEPGDLVALVQGFTGA